MEVEILEKNVDLTQMIVYPADMSAEEVFMLLTWPALSDSIN